MIPDQTAVLLRVSALDQKHDSQREVIQDWLVGQGLDPEAVRWYVEKESGRKMSREALDRLRADIFAGRVKTVVVYKVDRLARRLKDGLNLLCDWTEQGVRFVAVTQQIDLSGAVGRMLAAVLLGLAEIEWEYRRERQVAGISAAKKSGVYRGRKPGTNKKPPARIRELRDKGLRAAEIAEALGISVRTVWRHLGESGAEAGAGAAAVGEEQIADARPEQ